MEVEVSNSSISPLCSAQNNHSFKTQFVKVRQKYIEKQNEKNIFNIKNEN